MLELRKNASAETQLGEADAVNYLMEDLRKSLQVLEQHVKQLLGVSPSFFARPNFRISWNRYTGTDPAAARELFHRMMWNFVNEIKKMMITMCYRENLLSNVCTI